MSLKEQIEARIAELTPQIPPEILEVMREATDTLIAAGLSSQAVQPGHRAPDFSLPAVDGGTVRLTELLARGPAVLNFYRGAWCPYCNLELRALDQALPEIRARGADLVSISPNLPERTAAFAAENPFGFRFLSDVDNQVARRYGLVFRLPVDLAAAYRQLGIDLPAYDGNPRWELPMPATYVVAPDGTIAAGFVHEDYTRRMEPADILSALDRL